MRSDGGRQPQDLRQRGFYFRFDAIEFATGDARLVFRTGAVRPERSKRPALSAPRR